MRLSSPGGSRRGGDSATFVLYPRLHGTWPSLGDMEDADVDMDIEDESE